MQRKEIYKCNICGKVIEILNSGAPETICCGAPMQLMKEQTADWKGEKHVPKITIDGNKVTVDVGISMGTFEKGSSSTLPYSFLETFLQHGNT